MNLPVMPYWSPPLFSLINPERNWPESSARQHRSFPDTQPITVLPPKGRSVAVGLGDKTLFLRVGRKKSMEGRHLIYLIFSEITSSAEKPLFLTPSSWLSPTAYLNEEL